MAAALLRAVEGGGKRETRFLGAGAPAEEDGTEGVDLDRTIPPPPVLRPEGCGSWALPPASLVLVRDLGMAEEEEAEAEPACCEDKVVNVLDRVMPLLGVLTAAEEEAEG